MCSSDIFLGVLAILFPPLPVWVKRGICSADSLINILLFVLGYVPGLIHAWYIIAKFPDEYEYDYDTVPQNDSEGGYQRREGDRVRYIIIDRNHGNRGQGQGQQQSTKGQRGNGPNYGTQQQSGGRSGRGGNQQASSAAGRPAPQQQGVTRNDNGEGRSDGTVPPSYAEVVAGDHKVQTQD